MKKLFLLVGTLSMVGHVFGGSSMSPECLAVTHKRNALQAQVNQLVASKVMPTNGLAQIENLSAQIKILNDEIGIVCNPVV
jgi:hypothetical protein